MYWECDILPRDNMHSKYIFVYRWWGTLSKYYISWRVRKIGLSRPRVRPTRACKGCQPPRYGEYYSFWYMTSPLINCSVRNLCFWLPKSYFCLAIQKFVYIIVRPIVFVWRDRRLKGILFLHGSPVRHRNICPRISFPSSALARNEILGQKFLCQTGTPYRNIIFLLYDFLPHKLPGQKFVFQTGNFEICVYNSKADCFSLVDS